MTNLTPLLLTLTATLALATPPVRIPVTFESDGASATARGQGLFARFTDHAIALTAPSGTVQISFPGAARTPRLEQRQSHTATYLHGANPAAWRTAVPQYAQLRYPDLYPGVDLLFYNHNRSLEYDFLLRPGADPRRIALEFSTTPRLDSTGALVLPGSTGEILHHRPVAYQTSSDGRRLPVPARYALAGRTVHFELGAYDPALSLVIDPVLQYATYLGGSTPVNAAADSASVVALDANDNIYIAGRTVSTDFPLQDAIQSKNKGSGDAFVMKFDPTGQHLLYSTYLGGGSLEYVYAIAVDKEGQVHLAGQTGSVDFPLSHPVQSKIAGLNDAFVLKLDATGQHLVFSTLLGGQGNEQAMGLGLDQYGNVYTGGYTGSVSFPVKDALQPKLAGSSDGFLAKFTPEGELVFSTYLGGTGQDEIYAIAVDPEGFTYATGFILTPGLATEGAAQTKMLSRDAFVTKITPDGQALKYFTYLGGHGTDYANAIAIDAAGNAYIAGYTDSADLPARYHALQPERAGNSDAFLAAVDPDGAHILWSTYLGGTARTNPDDEMIRALAIDPDGYLYATGVTTSKDFPVTRQTQTDNAGGRDAFAAKISPAGDTLVFSTYFGGQAEDDAYSIAVSPLRSFVIAGLTYSADLPLEKPFSAKRGSTSDALAARICDPVMFLSATRLDFAYTQGAEELPAAQDLTVTACKSLELTLEQSPDSPWLTATVNQETGVVTLTASPAGLEPGDYEASITLSAPDVFFGPITVPVKLQVLPPPPPPEEEAPSDPPAISIN